MATIVTGGTGFIGSNIVRELAQHGHQVVSIDVAKPDAMALRYLEPQSSNVTWVHGDILDQNTMDRVLEDHEIDKIVHAAVYTAIREDIERSESRRIVSINVDGTANLLELARKAQVARFVYVSSGGVYEGLGSQGQTLTEDTPLHPRQLYNATKYASELITHRYGELHGFEAAAVRLGGPYGPMERATGHRVVMSTLHQWTGKAVRGETIDAETEGYWDFTYVLDIAAGIRTVLDAPSLTHEVYNLNRGVQVSAQELVSAFREASPSANINLRTGNGADMPQSSSSGRIMDSSRIRDDLHFEARYDLVAGLEAYIQWRREFGYTT